ncbi:Uncharacterised protein [Mycobacteroides abscessus subsp. abscessus]|uniref:hypothetical protein n=1 Tax=Mycobacteroides abscessus TaxID=36809 RepID=UPI00092A6FCE|nr:hypothetical protein [Mycobacteroides abscessus]SHQ96488.1 Uncharacterised protein [Mycobacteroides abscessus subsp. abscessus]
MRIRGWTRRIREGSRPSAVSATGQLYPYLVPQGYPDSLSTTEQEQRQIGHRLSVALVTAHGSTDAQVLAGVSASQLATAGIDLSTAYARADETLSGSLSTGQIALEFFERGPVGTPTVVASGSWLAATALIASQLHKRMSQLLGEEIIAAVPHRELLFLFSPDSSPGMAEIIEAEHNTAAKPLTTGLFILDSNGPRPLP